VRPFYVIVQAPNSRHFVSLCREILTLVQNGRTTTALSLKEFALIMTFSLLFAAGAQIWVINAATNELTAASETITWDQTHNELELVKSSSTNPAPVVRLRSYRCLLSVSPACSEIVSGLELNAELCDMMDMSK
jgi:hypothetical protein